MLELSHLPLAPLALAPIHWLFIIPLCLLSVFLTLLILVQRGRGGGLTGALGGMGGQSAFGAKAGDLFTKITIVTAMIWILLSMGALKVLHVGKFSKGVGSSSTPVLPGTNTVDPLDTTPGTGLTPETTPAPTSGDTTPSTPAPVDPPPPAEAPAAPAPSTPAPVDPAPAAPAESDDAKK
jgi:preprotein translocase subunit SecG